MFDWASFLSGLIGAFLGGGVTLLIALLARRDRRRSELRPLVREITSGLQTLVANRSAEGVPNGAYGPETSEAMLNAARAIAELPMHAGRSGRSVASWVDRKMFQILHTDDDMGRVNTLLQVAEFLGSWVGGVTPSRRFKRAAARIDADPDDIANNPPPSSQPIPAASN